MPHFYIETNVPKSKIPSDFLKTTTALIAKTLGKPESYVAVTVQPDTLMMWGGSEAPCGNARLLSIGQLGVEQNQKHSSVIYPHIEKNLGIPGDRLYLQFVDETTANIGYQGTTFKTILG